MSGLKNKIAVYRKPKYPTCNLCHSSLMPSTVLMPRFYVFFLNCGRKNSNPPPQIPTFYCTLHNRWNCNCDRVYSYIRFCHIARWTFKRELILSGPHLMPSALWICVCRSETEDFRDWKQERDLCPISGLKLEGATGQGIWQHLGAQSGPWPATSKDMETSVIKSPGAEFCQGKN